MIQPWNPSTFNSEIIRVLNDNSDLIYDFFSEDSRLMNEHLNSDPYESLKPNRFHSCYTNLLEDILTPVLAESRIIVWHYTRLTDFEVNLMQENIVPSSLSYLQKRLDALVAEGILSTEESKLIFELSPYHTQAKSRENMLWTVTVPLPCDDHGVAPLLGYWGGESAYFRLTNEPLKNKL